MQVNLPDMDPSWDFDGHVMCLPHSEVSWPNMGYFEIQFGVFKATLIPVLLLMEEILHHLGCLKL